MLRESSIVSASKSQSLVYGARMRNVKQEARKALFMLPVPEPDCRFSEPSVIVSSIQLLTISRQLKQSKGRRMVIDFESLLSRFTAES